MLIFGGVRATPRYQAIRRAPTGKGFPTYSLLDLLVKVALGCVPVRCVETTLDGAI